jgi:lipid A ethanolaminephosphotransferase
MHVNSQSRRHAETWPRRPAVNPLVFNLVLSAYLLAAFNAAFWSKLGTIFEGQPLHMASFGAAVWGLTFFTLSLITLPWLHRFASVLLVFVAAGAAWYQDHLGIIIDKLMIQNVMNTTYAESRQLITLPYLQHMLLTAVLPSAFLFWPRIRYPAALHLAWRMPLAVVASFLLTFALLFSDLKANASVIREHRDLMGSYQPGATIAAAVRYAKMEYGARSAETAPLGLDAAKGPHLAAADKPVLLVVFAGETARAQNFGLDGYSRETTPKLAARDLVNFPETTSCGTSTAVSLPCMFSPLAKANYSRQGFMEQENLLDVLAHAGVAPVWIDNNTGDQSIARRTGARRIEANIDAAACNSGECTDAALLGVLSETLAGLEQDTVLVMHMIGSHGPAYYLRYPQDSAPFTPDCRTAEFADCTRTEIINAYDNTIAMTDHVLDQAITMLEAQDKVLPAMLYVSDHGESLGEAGLYLHAAPGFMAPEEQTRVPFLMWLPERFQAAMGLDAGCLMALSRQPASHDNFFHTVLGLMDIGTGVRDPALDLTETCRRKEARA